MLRPAHASGDSRKCALSRNRLPARPRRGYPRSLRRFNGSGARVQVHGVFRIHGVEHELMIPVRVEMADDHWTLTSHFVVPYVKWGIKNPSNLLLHVSPSVE